MRKLQSNAVVKEWKPGKFVITSDNFRHECERLFVDRLGYVNECPPNDRNSMDDVYESWKKYIRNVRAYDKIIKARGLVVEELEFPDDDESFEPSTSRNEELPPLKFNITRTTVQSMLDYFTEHSEQVCTLSIDRTPIGTIVGISQDWNSDALDISDYGSF